METENTELVIFHIKEEDYKEFKIIAIQEDKTVCSLVKDLIHEFNETGDITCLEDKE